MTETERRKFLKLVGASLAGAAGMGILGCTPENTRGVADVPVSDNAESPIADAVDDAPSAQTVSRKALVERLKALDESEAPSDLSPGAHCYKPAGIFYEKKPCQDCGEIMDEGRMNEILLAYNVPLKRIQNLGVDATLILPEHCPTCGFGLNACGLDWKQESELRKLPEEWQRKKFHLKIKYPDDPDFVRVELDEAHDLELMALFLQGKDRWEGKQGDEYALKDKVDQLKKLFGVKEP